MQLLEHLIAGFASTRPESRSSSRRRATASHAAVFESSAGFSVCCKEFTRRARSSSGSDAASAISSAVFMARLLAAILATLPQPPSIVQAAGAAEFYSPRVRTLTRPGSAVMMASAASSAPNRSSSWLHACPCWRAEKPTSRTMPAWGKPRTMANSPKSLSRVTSTRFSSRARARISWSPGSRGQLPLQSTSWPSAASSATAPPHTAVQQQLQAQATCWNIGSMRSCSTSLWA